MRLQYVMHELEIGWDLSLRAQGRKASIVNSIWLKGEGDNNFFGKSRFGQSSSHQSNQNKGRESRGNFNFPLGINLEGTKLNEYQQGNNSHHNGDNDLDREKGQLSGLAHYGVIQMTTPSGLGRLQEKGVSCMDCELEDEPFLNKEGKKRQRSNTLITNVSNTQDLLEVAGENFFYPKQISAAAIGHVDRRK